jgi:phosphomannomutase/phosphoglucomutase
LYNLESPKGGLMAPLKESIFREYDIRGIVDKELPDEVVSKISSAFATVYVREGKKRIAVGMDGRPSSDSIKNIVLNQLARYGLEVIDIGLVPTPVMYYAVFKMELGGGIIITASHNPPEYNGFKALVGKEAQAGDQIHEIYRIARSGNFPPEQTGTIQKQNLIDDYLDYICSDIQLNKKIKVVVDCGNGTGGLTAIPLYQRLGAKVIDLYSEVDGTFPNHHPDPTKIENLKDLIQKVKETNADLGIGLDGDADRIGVVDKNGTVLWGDQLLVIFARDILQKNPGRKVISEVKASEVLYSEIKKYRGVPIMWKTGHSIIKKKIFQENAILAGEVSGHIFFNDRWFGFDDAVYSGARLLEILANSNQTLSEIIKSIPKAFNTPEIRIDTTEEAKFQIVNQIVSHFEERNEVIDIDGARIKFPFGWALVRASNTQPALVIRYEADSEEHLNEIKDTVEPVLNKIRKQIEK